MTNIEIPRSTRVMQNIGHALIWCGLVGSITVIDRQDAWPDVAMLVSLAGVGALTIGIWDETRALRKMIHELAGPGVTVRLVDKED